MQNFLELLDKLLAAEIPTENKAKGKDRDNDENEMKVLCAAEGKFIIIVDLTLKTKNVKFSYF